MDLHVLKFVFFYFDPALPEDAEWGTVLDDASMSMSNHTQNEDGVRHTASNTVYQDTCLSDP